MEKLIESLNSGMIRCGSQTRNFSFKFQIIFRRREKLLTGKSKSQTSFSKWNRENRINLSDPCKVNNTKMVKNPLKSCCKLSANFLSFLMKFQIREIFFKLLFENLLHNFRFVLETFQSLIEKLQPLSPSLQSESANFCWSSGKLAKTFRWRDRKLSNLVHLILL